MPLNTEDLVRKAQQQGQDMAASRKAAYEAALQRKREQNSRLSDRLAARRKLYQDTQQALVDAFHSDPRYIVIQDFLTPETNLELFTAVQKVWESWRIQKKAAPYYGTHTPVPFPPRITYPQINENQLPYPGSWASKLTYRPNFSRYIDPALKKGGTVRLEFQQSWWGRHADNTDYYVAQTARERINGKFVSSRLFELKFSFDGPVSMMELFPNHPKSPHHKTFWNQDDLLGYMVGQLVDTHGDIARFPALTQSMAYRIDRR